LECRNFIGIIGINLFSQEKHRKREKNPQSKGDLRVSPVVPKKLVDKSMSFLSG
jgi:hypothetical protein